MADFKEFGDKACNFAKNMADKANEAVEIQKLKSRIREEKHDIDDIFNSIGRSVYNSYKEDAAVNSEFADACSRIDEKYDVIADLNDKIDAKKGCTRCANCQAVLNPGAAYCSKCGAPV